MFLTAVLQAYTDSASQTHSARPPRPEQDRAVALPERLEEALTLPIQERLQPLPSAHRSRWV